jgi:uncharacterized protein YvpB
MRKRFRVWPVRRIGLLVAIGLVVGFGTLFFVRTQGGVRPSMALANSHPVNKVISLEFGREVAASFSTTIEPAVRGKWQKKQGLFGVHGLEFKPDKPLVPASVYRVKLKHIREVTGQVLGDQTVTVSTEVPAVIEGVTPAAGAPAVLPEASIVVRLKGLNGGLRHLVADISPAVALDGPVSTDDRTFTWKPHAALAQGQAYQFAIRDTNQTDPAKAMLYTGGFMVVPEPGLNGPSRDHFYPGDGIDIHFSEAMKPETVKFDMGMAGQGNWADPATYHFVPSGLAPGRTYTYKILGGSVSVRGGKIPADRGFNISTPGAAVVVGSSPGGGGVSRSAAVRFTFDQPVDHASAQAHFGISPAVPGNFSWSGNTMVFAPGGLDFQTGYRASVEAGVVSTYGLPSARAFVQGFSTELEVVRLNVPYYRQPYSLSCEATSLRMALAHYGISASEMDIAGRFGYAPRPRDTGTNSWDDPYSMFVGDINGTMGVTGWGVYAEPVAAAARSFGRDATAYRGVSVNFIAQQIHAGFPVVAWGTTYPVRPDSWNTSSRGVVSAPRSEHARLIVGVTGRADAPTSFVMYDPIYGQCSWTPEQLSANLNSYDGSNQIVVVR